MEACVVERSLAQWRLPGQASAWRLSLVIPAWNEQETIARAIREADAALSAVAVEYEILIVDDGSSDGTAEVVRREAAANPCVRLIQQPQNLGYGAALRTGFQAATLDLVAFTDADCQFDLDELDYMLPLTERYDVVCGYRIDRQDPAHRRFFSWGYNTLVTALLGTPVRDVDCALKVFRRERISSILPESDHFLANAEILTQARRQGLAVVEVGVHHRPRLAGQSKVSWREIPKTLATLLPFWWSRALFPGQREPMGSDDRRWRWIGLALLVLVAGLLLFGNLSYPLCEPDEGRYAEIAREMLLSGDWVVPTLNHQPYYDKPPLFYWLTATSFACWGVHDWSARLVPAAAAFLTVISTFLFGRRMIGTRAAFLGALTLTLSAGLAVCGRMLILDSLLTLFVALTLFTLHEAVASNKLRWSWWTASSVCCALGVMTKGPVALVLAAPPLLAYVWLNRGQARPRLSHWAAYVGCVLVLAAPWHVAIIVRNPQFGQYFFGQHHLDRFLLGTFHPRPFWFYVPVIFLGAMPWSLLLVPFSRFLFNRSSAVALCRNRPMGYYLLWAGWCVLFFSLSRGKLPPYVLPSIPAIAILVGCYLENVLFRGSLAAMLERSQTRVPRDAVLVLFGTALVVVTGALYLRLEDLNGFFVEASLCTAGLITVAVLGRRLPSKAAWALCAAVAFGVLFETTRDLIPTWATKYSPLGSSREVVELLKNPRTPLACYGREWGSIPFYLDRNDVENFRHRPPQELTDFLESHPGTCLLVKRSADLEWFRPMIPQGMSMTKLADLEVVSVLLVDRQPPAGTDPLAFGQAPNAPAGNVASHPVSRFASRKGDVAPSPRP